MILEIRARISLLALMVKVQQITSCGRNPRCDKRYATRAANVFVLPDPGGARTWRIEAGEVTAVRCAEFNPSRMRSIEWRALLIHSVEFKIIIHVCLEPVYTYYEGIDRKESAIFQIENTQLEVF